MHFLSTLYQQFQVSCGLLILVFGTIAATITFDRDLTSIIYSPYTRHYKPNSPHPPLSFVSKTSYTLDDIKSELTVISSKFNSVISLGMGVTYGTEQNSWNQTNSECLIASAAAELNQISNTTKISVLQGIYIEQFEKIELINAIKSTMHANTIFPNTVLGFVFHITPFIENSQLIEIIKLFYNTTQKLESKSLKNLKIGLRFPKNKCQALLSDHQHLLIDNMKSMDFIICPYFPNLNDSSRTNSLELIADFEKFIKQKNSVFPNLRILFESSWPISAANRRREHNKKEVFRFMEYWSFIEKWSSQTRNSIVVFEAFDQPWICNLGETQVSSFTPECHYGMWFLNEDKSNNYELKSDLLVLHFPIEDSNPATDISPVILGVIGVICVIFVLTVGISFYTIKQLKNKSILSTAEVQEFINGKETYLDRNLGEKDVNVFQKFDYALILPYDKSLELSRSKFTIEENHILGSGTYGTVYKGRIQGILAPVAFKTIKTGRCEELKHILSEIKIMSYIGKHSQIVTLLGAYTKDVRKGTVFIGMEYCTKGSLQNYLRNHSITSDGTMYVNVENSTSYANTMDTTARYTHDPTSFYTALESTDKNNVITLENKIKWCHQISTAMEFLEAKKVIHADLAARNVLLTSDFDAKVTDFGLSRRLYTYTEYVKTSAEPMPWRWMSLESLKQMNFSSKSDVWSYGVTMWEIFSLGNIPYPGLNWSPDFPNLIEEGLRLFKPNRTDENIYRLMRRCWETVPEDRPSFQEIAKMFRAETQTPAFYENVQC